MEPAYDEDAWHIDPVTSMIKPSAELHDPVVVVVERLPSLAVAIAEVCDFLHVRIESVGSTRGIIQVLRETRPIAVLSEASEVDCGVYDLLMSVAGYDRTLPVLMILDDRFNPRRALDAVRNLWELTDVIRVGQRPGIRGLIDFLFLAGRKSGGRLENSHAQ